MQIRAYICLTLTMALFGVSVLAKPYTGMVSKNHLIIESLIEKGRYEEAIVKVKEILDDNPDDLNARAYLGSIYSIQYKLDAATREYKRVIEQDKDNAAAHNGLGMVYYRRTTSSDMAYREKIPELLDSALEEFSLAVQNAPNYYQAYNNAGKVLFETGRIPEAEAYFKKATELKPNYSEGVENYGRVLFSKNLIDPAIRKYKEAIRLNTRNSSAYYHLGEALIAKGEYSEAIKHLQTSLYLFPNSAPVHNMLGKAYEMQGNEAAAIAEYKKAAMIKPEFTAAYLSLAEIYENRGDDEFATAELRNAIAINPDFHEAKAKIAKISLNIGKTDQAIKYYRELKGVPAFKNVALKGLARAYFLKASSNPGNDVIEVENALKKALSYDPENLELYLALLRVAKISQNPGRSEFYLNRIVKKSDDKRINHIVKGEAHLTVREFGNAEREFIKAINQARTNNDLLKFSEIFIANRMYSPARIALNRVIPGEAGDLRAKRLLERIKRNEEQAVSKLKIADAFYGEGQHRAAIEAYKDAISLDPCIEEAHLKLARAYEKAKNYNLALEHYKAYISLVDAGRDTGKFRKRIEKLKRKMRDNQH